MTITSTTTQAAIRSMAGVCINALYDLDGHVLEYEVETPSRYSIHTDRGLALVAYADALEVEASLRGPIEADRLADEAARALLGAFSQNYSTGLVAV